jgi:hypothetical protein
MNAQTVPGADDTPGRMNERSSLVDVPCPGGRRPFLRRCVRLLDRQSETVRKIWLSFYTNDRLLLM